MTKPIQLKGLMNCAVVELSGLANYYSPLIKTDQSKHILQNILAQHGLKTLGPIVLFSGAAKSKREPSYTSKLAVYIEKNNLGEIYVLKPVKNPVSGNYVVLYGWIVNVKNLTKWASKQ